MHTQCTSYEHKLNIAFIFCPAKFSPYGFPRVSESPLPQTPVNQLTNGPVLPAENAAGAAAPSGAAPPQTQQQVPRFYMFDSIQYLLDFFWKLRLMLSSNSQSLFHRIHQLYTCSSNQW